MHKQQSHISDPPVVQMRSHLSRWQRTTWELQMNHRYCAVNNHPAAAKQGVRPSEHGPLDYSGKAGSLVMAHTDTRRYSWVLERVHLFLRWKDPQREMP